ncbi:MAG: helix-turn-helix transcriptional regulator [Sedimentisphaerales bacterium]|nr:helix-turn-helix transcriptional regulator [Sedimentisphaerales bacterium]
MSRIHSDITEQLEQRRRDLGLPYGVLSRRSGLGVATVQRTLNGVTEARMETLSAIALALGVTVHLGVDTNVTEHITLEQMLQQRAQEKALMLAGLAQASAGLEGQAVSEKTMQQAVKELERKLLAGSKRKLWES